MTSQRRDDAFDAMRRKLHVAVPHLQFTEGRAGEGRWLRPKSTAPADYYWSLWFYPNGERHIYATPSGDKETDGVADESLWYHPFELESFSGSVSALAAAFEREVLLLWRSATRITMTRGIINWTISLEYMDADNQWHRAYRFYALRAGWEAPTFEGESKTFFAPPLARDDGSASSTTVLP